MAEDTVAQGRGDLSTWEIGKPDNFFTSDANLRYVLRRTLGDDGYSALVDNLEAFGAACAMMVDQAAKIEDLMREYPRLQRFTGIGERVEQIEFHPHHYLNGKIIWNTNILALQREPGNMVHQQALFYLLGQNGEAGHSCSIACTA